MPSKSTRSRGRSLLLLSAMWSLVLASCSVHSHRSRRICTKTKNETGRPPWCHSVPLHKGAGVEPVPFASTGRQTPISWGRGTHYIACPERFLAWRASRRATVPSIWQGTKELHPTTGWRHCFRGNGSPLPWKAITTKQRFAGCLRQRFPRPRRLDVCGSASAGRPIPRAMARKEGKSSINVLSPRRVLGGRWYLGRYALAAAAIRRR